MMAVKPTKEYFRKPYLVDDKADAEESESSDYRYMMDTDWQGLQDSSYIVVQSVRKKPYAEDDYEEMEQKANGYTGIDWNFNWNWQRPKFNWGATFSTIEPEYQSTTQTRKLTGRLSWIQCPITVGVSKTYTIIVKNSYVSQRAYAGGRLQSNQVTYSPSDIYLEKKISVSRGLTITRVWRRNSVTYATLETSSTASGEYYIYASDGTNTIERTISVSSKVSTIVLRKTASPYQYYKLEDLVQGNEIPYAVFTTQTSVFLTADAGQLVQSYSITSPDSYTDLYTYYNTLKLTDDTDLASCVQHNDLYYDADMSQSYYSANGWQCGAGLPIATPIYRYSALTTYNYGVGSTIITSGRTYYFKYSGISLIITSTSYSYTEYDNNGTYSYIVDGTTLLNHKLIDDNSYVVAGGHVSVINGDALTPDYYHISGMFSGSGVSFNLTWNPTILFGSL